jgi:hypothetical protein
VWAPLLVGLTLVVLVYGFGLAVVGLVWWQQRKERD